MENRSGFAELWSVISDKVGGFFKMLWQKILGIIRRANDNCDEPCTEEKRESDGEPETTPSTTTGKVLKVLKTAGIWLYRLRAVFMAVPVAFCALWLAIYNLRNLPEQVGLNLQANGEYAIEVSRSLAVFGPLGITAACLVLMFLSNKTLHPWVISIFTLVLPLLILLINLFPQ